EATTAPIPAFRGDQAEFGDWGEPEPWEEGEEPPMYFIDFWTDVEADVRERMESVEGPEWDYLQDHVVAEAMSRTVVSVPGGADIRHAARLMTDAGVNRLLVVDGTGLAGLVSASDIVRAVADGAV
ncbi:MAG: CBS domain-containing protein, partial [Actinobacteria bacterium]|nr:CBS domain-containing protein [Actinomycetota bacterium]